MKAHTFIMTHDTTAIGTIGGTTFALLTIPTQTLENTIVCAAIAGATSWTVTMILKSLYAYVKEKIKNRKK